MHTGPDLYYMGSNTVCRITWRTEILNEIEYLIFHNYNVVFCGFFCGVFWKKIFPGSHVFWSDEISLLIYLCLLPSSATVKMDNGENM